MDELKRAVRNMAFEPFFNGESLPAADDGYEVSLTELLYIHIRVPTPAGPRYFEIRVSEKY